MSNQSRNLLMLSAQIVAAHAGHNQVEIDALPNIIRKVYNTLADLRPALDGDGMGDKHDQHDHGHDGHDGHQHGVQHSHHDNDVYVHPTYGQTVFGDHLICMEDGLSMKMLKRHLLTVHGMTPDQYRAKWGLADDYPMVAADYAKLRSSLALQSGLGLKPEDRPTKSRKSRRS